MKKQQQQKKNDKRRKAWSIRVRIAYILRWNLDSSSTDMYKIKSNIKKNIMIRMINGIHEESQ